MKRCQGMFQIDPQTNRLPYLDVVLPPLDDLESLAALLAGEFVVPDGPTKFGQVADVVLALPLVDLVTDVTQFGGEFVKLVPFGEISNLTEKLRNRIGFVAGTLGSLDDLEITLLDHPREVLDGGLAGDVGLGGDPAGVPRLGTRQRNVTDALGSIHPVRPRRLFLAHGPFFIINRTNSFVSIPIISYSYVQKGRFRPHVEEGIDVGMIGGNSSKIE